MGQISCVVVYAIIYVCVFVYMYIYVYVLIYDQPVARCADQPLNICRFSELCVFVIFQKLCAHKKCLLKYPRRRRGQLTDTYTETDTDGTMHKHSALTDTLHMQMNRRNQ